MNFQDFIENGKVRKGLPDIQLAKSLVGMSDNQLEVVGRLEIDDKSASTIMSNLYEALREIVEAACAKKGYKVYSHEAFTYFLKESGEELIAKKFDRLRIIRNNIHYYGKPAEKESVLADKSDIIKIISFLKHKFLADLF